MTPQEREHETEDGMARATSSHEAGRETRPPGVFGGFLLHSSGGIVLGLLALAGCGREAGSAADVSRVDSAGVEIVESSGPGWTPGSAWRVEDAPLVEVGVVEGPEEDQLFRVRDAARLPDGRIVVANSGTAELRLYDPQGRHLRSIGGKGEGPGEFRGIARVDLAGDTIWGYDRRNRRLSAFLPGGTLLRTVSVEAPGERAFPTYVGRLGDGRFLGQVTRFGESGAAAAEEVVHRRVVYMTYGPDGTPRDSLESLRSQGRYVQRSEAGVLIIGLPFGPRPVAAIGEGRFYLGRGDKYRIDVRDPDGRLVRSMRLADETPRPVTPELVDAYVKEQLAGVEDPAVRRNRRETYGELPFPDRVSAFDDLLVDAAGQLWVRDHRLPGESERDWTVFDSTGALLGSLTTPEGFHPLEIGDDWMLGRRVDELGVERMQLLPLRKPQRWRPRGSRR